MIFAHYGDTGSDVLSALDTVFAKPVQAVASIFTQPAEAKAQAAAQEAASREQISADRGETVIEVVKWGSLGLAAIVGVAILAKGLTRRSAPATPTAGYRRRRRSHR